MNDQKEILEGYSSLEKGAYLGAIATIATADRTATEEEMEYIVALCDSANLSDAQTDMVKRAANELTGDELKKSLDVLKTSDLKYSLITDMIAFAESDGSYTDEEKTEIERIATYLGVNEKQFSLLDEFAHEATEEAQTVSESPREEQGQSFFSGGLKDKMQNAGINTSGLMKGLIGVMGPILLAGMLGGGRRRSGGGMFGNASRGGGMLGGGAMGGGLGSLIGMLGGGRRNRPAGRSGGLFGGLLKGF